jgi:hypothetical protein
LDHPEGLADENSLMDEEELEDEELEDEELDDELELLDDSSNSLGMAPLDAADPAFC